MSIKRLLLILEITVLIIFLCWHLRLGLVRFFDADEFAHLHWGYSLSIGERPYTDFFYLFPPFFLYPIAGIFKIFGRTTVAILNARMFIFTIFLATNGILFLLARKVRNIHFALLTLIFFSFLPLPFDKMIEVRPDLIATGLSLLGMLFFVKGNEGYEGDKGKQTKYFFLSGLFYAASLGFVPKTIFFLVPVGLVIAYRCMVEDKGNRGNRGDIKREAIYFFGGFLPVAVVLLVMILSFGNFSFAVYSMTRMATEVTRTLGAKFYMRPDLFFYPNETYYGISGWSPALIANLIIYVFASIWAIHRLMTFNLGGDKGDKGDEEDKNLREFLIAGTFFANLAAFVYFYPLKHAQYLIPVAPFIAFYFADLWETTLSKLLKELKSLKMGITLTLLFFLCLVGWQMNQKKEQWVNKPVLDKMNNFLSIIPADAPVYDLSGETIFFPDGYYFCCLPYGQYEEALYFKIPDIEKEMEKRDTKYVNVGDGSRLDQIPAGHAKYIRENFVPEISSKTLLIRKTN